MTLALQSTRYSRLTKLLSYRSNIAWLFYVLLGLVLLPGRFEWSSQTRTANWRGFDCSAFFLCLLIPLIATLLKRSKIQSVGRNSILAGVTLLLSLPYHWLRLDRMGLNQWSFTRIWPNSKGLPRPLKLVWFPQAFSEPPQIPHELLLFTLLTTFLLAGGWLYVRIRRRARKSLSKSTVVLGSAVILLIMAESWMHLSMRSPYTYYLHFEKPAAEDFWYHSLLIGDRGAVNGDYFVFRDLEQVFMGTPQPLNGMLIRRPFPFYLSSQFVYFVNPYYVMLSFNVTVWILAVFAFREFVAAHFDDSTATIAALLMASGPGFIMYVAQPQTYLWGYCAVAVVIWAHWRICGRPNARLRDYFLFGGVLSLALLTYDLFTLLLYLIGYELLFKKSLWKITAAAVLAIGIYIVFGLLTAHMKSFAHDTLNSDYIGRSIKSTIDLLRGSPLSLKSYNLYAGLVPNYIRNLGNSVFVFPLLVAVFGLFCLNGSKLKLVGILLLPSLASAAVLYLGLGGTYLAQMPRFSYIGYPAIYILGAVALWTAARAARSLGLGPRWRYAADSVILCGVIAHIALVNADVFGHPWLYSCFYWQSADPTHF